MPYAPSGSNSNQPTNQRTNHSVFFLYAFHNLSCTLLWMVSNAAAIVINWGCKHYTYCRSPTHVIDCMKMVVYDMKFFFCFQLFYHFSWDLSVWSDWNFRLSTLRNQSCAQSGDPVSYRLQLLSRIAVVKCFSSCQSIGCFNFGVASVAGLRRLERAIVYVKSLTSIWERQVQLISED
jgi:hypothetical protein